MQQKGKLIKPAEYARLRGLNRSTVSRQIHDGKIPTINGKIDVAAADQARRQNIDAKKQAGGRANRARVKQTAPISSGDVAHDAVLDTLRRIAAPAESLRFARAALVIGCTPVQAYALGLWLACQVVGPIDVEPEELTDFPEPSRREWKRLLGSKFDFKAGEAAFDEIAVADTQETLKRKEKS